MNDWRRVAQRDRPYNAYNRPRYIEQGCDHNGLYCKCDPPFHLRPSSPAEEAIADRIYGMQDEEASDDSVE